MKYEKFLVIGTGAVACNCAVTLKKRGVDVTFVESRSSGAMSSEGFCLRQGVDYQFVRGGVAVRSFIESCTCSTLIVSAANRYIFPPEIVENPLFTIINYHGALLPKYPGRNAEAWAIFNRDAEAGITWHRVTSSIDAGDVLIQKSIPLTANVTSFKLLREYAKLATEAFEEIIDDVIRGAEKYHRQEGEHGEMCFSWMKPNDGILNFDWNGEEMSAFLRAMDYGLLQTLGEPKVIFCGDTYFVNKYKIQPIQTVGSMTRFNQDSNTLTIQKDNFEIIIQLNKQ